MSTAPARHAEVVVIGAGVVGCAVALSLARRGAAVVVLESESEPALAASATNSGILHTGFDSPPGELETELLLMSARLRDAVADQLEIPMNRCGALMRTADAAAVAELAAHNGVEVRVRDDGATEIPGETVTDPVRYVLALIAEAQRHGAELRTSTEVTAIEPRHEVLAVRTAPGDTVNASVAINCAGLHADAVARLVGDDSFEIYPRKGEFLVFDPPPGQPLERILLPEHTARTRGVLVFPTIDGKIVAGPTAVDLEDKRDWSARPEAAGEILPKATAMYPPLADADQIAAYAGLRPAGRGVNYVIGPSRSCARLVNVAAIRSTGLSASLGIARRVAQIVASLGMRLGSERPLQGGPAPPADAPWWLRAARHRAAA